MRQDQLGVGKIGWELERISTKEKVGIGMENNCRESIGINECQNDKKDCYIGSYSNQENWAKVQMFLGTTVLEDNRQDIETQKGSASKIK